MFELINGNIEPCFAIGKIKLNMQRKDLEKIVPVSSIKNYDTTDVYECKDVDIWVDKKTNLVTQVTVFGEFKGKFLNQFGIGSYLADIETLLQEKAYNEYDIMITYEFKCLPGICFEIEDIDEDWDDFEWFKANAPIEHISVFVPDK